MNQPINQSINQSINHSLHQPMNQWINESINPSTDEAIDRQINRPINQAKLVCTLFVFPLRYARSRRTCFWVKSKPLLKPPPRRTSTCRLTPPIPTPRFYSHSSSNKCCSPQTITIWASFRVSKTRWRSVMFSSSSSSSSNSSSSSSSNSSSSSSSNSSSSSSSSSSNGEGLRRNCRCSSSRCRDRRPTRPGNFTSPATTSSLTFSASPPCISYRISLSFRNPQF